MKKAYYCNNFFFSFEDPLHHYQILINLFFFLNPYFYISFILCNCILYIFPFNKIKYAEIISTDLWCLIQISYFLNNASIMGIHYSKLFSKRNIYRLFATDHRWIGKWYCKHLSTLPRVNHNYLTNIFKKSFWWHQYFDNNWCTIQDIWCIFFFIFCHIQQG